MKAYISRDAMAALETLLEAAEGEEVCALLSGPAGGDGISIMAVHPVPNISPEPATGFQIDPALQARLQRKLRDHGRRMVGHFHSHPSGDPSPSPRDRAAADGDGWLWLIGAVADGEATVRAWLDGEKGFQAVPLVITGTENGESQWQGAA